MSTEDIDHSGHAAEEPKGAQRSIYVDEAIDAIKGYVVDASQYSAEDLAKLKTTDKGRVVLIPQPSDSPNDPLNWSPTKKFITLAIISIITGLPDFASAAGSVTLIPQAAEWGNSELDVQRSLAGNVFAIGAGGIIALMLSNYFGNLPILLLFHSLALGTGAWCAGATSLLSFLAARVLNGIFSSVCQSTALMWIKSMFFFHEHPRTINYWTAILVTSPYLGPCLAAFMCARTSWRWAYWLYTFMNGFALLGVLFYLDEPQFCRKQPVERYNPPRGSRISRLLGIEQWKRARLDGRTATQAIVNPLVALTKIPVILILVYYFLVVAWLVGFNSTISVWLNNYYGFTYVGLGCFFIADVVGAILGLILGHYLHDAFGRLYARRHSAHIHPEARLLIVYPSTLLCAVALIILGFALRDTWQYMVYAVMAAVQVCGYEIATTAVNAYLLDAYPEGSGEVCAWVTFARLVGGFMSVYVELDWVEGAGPATALGIQAAITAASLVCIVVLQIWGRKIRARQGGMVFVMGK